MCPSSNFSMELGFNNLKLKFGQNLFMYVYVDFNYNGDRFQWPIVKISERYMANFLQEQHSYYKFAGTFLKNCLLYEVWRAHFLRDFHGVNFVHQILGWWWLLAKKNKVQGVSKISKITPTFWEIFTYLWNYTELLKRWFLHNPWTDLSQILNLRFQHTSH